MRGMYGEGASACQSRVRLTLVPKRCSKTPLQLTQQILEWAGAWRATRARQGCEALQQGGAEFIGALLRRPLRRANRRPTSSVGAKMVAFVTGALKAGVRPDTFASRTKRASPLPCSACGARQVHRGRGRRRKLRRQARCAHMQAVLRGPPQSRCEGSMHARREPIPGDHALACMLHACKASQVTPLGWWWQGGARAAAPWAKPAQAWAAMAATVQAQASRAALEAGLGRHQRPL